MTQSWAALSDSELRAEVARRQWYHTLELRPGIETPGWFDLRTVPSRLPIPSSLAGRRALDVGTFEGFWAYELEARAADVVAIDILDPREWDWPAGSDEAVLAALADRKQDGAGFEIAAELRQSSVRRVEMSVYDLDPERLGTFDFAYVGSLLLHLRDPVRALEAVRSVLRPGGQMLSVDAIDLHLSTVHRRRPVAALDGIGRPWWWKPNLAALVRYAEAAGYRVVAGPRRIDLPRGAGQPVPPVPLWRRWRSTGRELNRLRRQGDAHGYVLAEPRV